MTSKEVVHNVRQRPSEFLPARSALTPAFEAPDPARVVGASVTFEPGARTAWHTHPLGQTLIVTAGSGRANAGCGRLRIFIPVT